jgi:hypothetical protein
MLVACFAGRQEENIKRRRQRRSLYLPSRWIERMSGAERIKRGTGNGYSHCRHRTSAASLVYKLADVELSKFVVLREHPDLSPCLPPGRPQ